MPRPRLRPLSSPLPQPLPAPVVPYRQDGMRCPSACVACPADDASAIAVSIGDRVFVAARSLHRVATLSTAGAPVAALAIACAAGERWLLVAALGPLPCRTVRLYALSPPPRPRSSPAKRTRQAVQLDLFSAPTAADNPAPSPPHQHQHQQESADEDGLAATVAGEWSLFAPGCPPCNTLSSYSSPSSPPPLILTTTTTTTALTPSGRDARSVTSLVVARHTGDTLLALYIRVDCALLAADTETDCKDHREISSELVHVRCCPDHPLAHITAGVCIVDDARWILGAADGTLWVLDREASCGDALPHAKRIWTMTVLASVSSVPIRALCYANECAALQQRTESRRVRAVCADGQVIEVHLDTLQHRRAAPGSPTVPVGARLVVQLAHVDGLEDTAFDGPNRLLCVTPQSGLAVTMRADSASARSAGSLLDQAIDAVEHEVALHPLEAVCACGCHCLTTDGALMEVCWDDGLPGDRSTETASASDAQANLAAALRSLEALEGAARHADQSLAACQQGIVNLSTTLVTLPSCGASVPVFWRKCEIALPSTGQILHLSAEHVSLARAAAGSSAFLLRLSAGSKTDRSTGKCVH